jgi:hypothetical protein
MNEEDIRSRASELTRQLEQSQESDEIRQLAQQLIPVLIAYWDVHPHSAMEMLEWTVMCLPLPLSHAVTRKVVAGWKAKETYDPQAGGSADHCYLSALILSENFDLADRPWVDEVLPTTLRKELKYPRWERMRDAEPREALVRSLAISSGLTLEDE